MLKMGPVYATCRGKKETITDVGDDDKCKGLFEIFSKIQCFKMSYTHYIGSVNVKIQSK